MKWCEHWSEYVWLACQRELDEAEVFGTLRPVRGMGLIELGFQEVRFPEYYVKKAEAAMNPPYKEAVLLGHTERFALTQVRGRLYVQSQFSCDELG